MIVHTPVFSSRLASVLESYWNKVNVSKSEGTLIKYSYALLSFDNYLSKTDYEGGTISENLIVDWLSSLSRYAPGTVSLYYTVIKQALNVGKAFGIDSQMPPSPSVSNLYLPHIYTPDEYLYLCEVADNMKTNDTYPWIHVEFPMILRILMACGTRVTETCNLKMKDTDLKNGVLKMLHTKKKKERYVPITETLRSILNSYCQAMGIIGNPDAFLFPGRIKDEPLNYVYFGQCFRRALSNANIVVNRPKRYARDICAHCIRHTFGCNSYLKLKKEGMSDDDIAAFLTTYMGHRSLKESQKYLKFTAEMVNDALDTFEEKIQTLYDCPVFLDETEWDD